MISGRTRHVRARLTEGGHKAVLANVVPLAEKTTFIKEGDSFAPGITAMLAA